ncbi:MAG: hypothetical protein AABW79_02975 [Nanoarchaeota archaeon]
MLKYHLNEKIFLRTAGIFYIILGITAFFNSYVINNPDQIYWFCYVSLFIIGIGLLLKDGNVIASQVNILAVGIIFWCIDFFHYLITGLPLWGITDYFFVESNFLVKIVTLQHVYTLPLTIYALSIIKITRKDLWKISLIQALIIFIIVSLFTEASSNINCIFSSCLSLFDLEPYYPWAWLMLVATMILITNAIITHLFFMKTKKSAK